jgi:hypothetical protein
MYHTDIDMRQASKEDFIRVVSDKHLLANLGVEKAEDAYNPEREHYLITHGSSEMIAELTARPDLTRLFKAVTYEVHMACPRTSILDIRNMCGAGLRVFANLTGDAKIDILVTDCTPGAVSNTGAKLGFKYLETNVSGKHVYAYFLEQLRNPTIVAQE